MRVLPVAIFLCACTTPTESRYPSSSGPMGVGASDAGVQGSNESPIDTGDVEQEDTGRDTGRT